MSELNKTNGRNWVTVASAGDLKLGDVVGVEVGKAKIAVYNVDQEFYATDNVCTHAFAILSEGWLDDAVIECPLHGGQFDVRTGEALCPPVETDLNTYAVRLQGDEVQVLMQTE